MLDDNGGVVASPRWQPRYRRLLEHAKRSDLRLSAVRSLQARTSPDMADRVGRMYRMYPWMSAGTILSLSRANIEPHTQVARFAAAVEARRRDNDPMGWLQPGERARAGALDVAARQSARRERALEGTVVDGSAPIRGGESWFDRNVDPVFSRFTPSVRADPSQMQSLSAASGTQTQTSGFDGQVVDSAVGMVSAAGEGVSTATKGASRAASAGMASPIQAVTGNFRNTVALVHPPDDAEVRPSPLQLVWNAFPVASVPAQMAGYDPASGWDGGQTLTGQIAHEAVGDLQAGQAPSIDLGDGYFIDPDSEIERDRHAQEVRRGTVIGPDGLRHALTPGRLLATEVVPPGSRPYEVISSIADLALSGPLTPGPVWKPSSGESPLPDPYTMLSGSTDAAVAMFADPTNVLLGGTAASNAAEAGVGRGRAGWGLLDGLRWTVDPEQVARQLDSEEFRTGAGQWLADASYADIRRATRRNPLPHDVEVALADATTVDDVAAILTPHVDEAGHATGIGLDVRNAGAPNGILNVGDSGLGVRRRLRQVRAFNMMPSDTIHLDDGSSTVEWAERFLRNAHADDEWVDYWTEAFARTTPGVMGRNQRFTLLRDMLGETERGILIDKYGVPEDVAHDLVRLFDETVGDQRQFAIDAAGGDVLPAWADPAVAGADAEDLLNDIGPLLLTQHSNGIIPAPDIRGIRQVTSPEWIERMTLAQNYREFRDAAYQVYGAGGGGMRSGRGPIKSNLPLSVLYEGQDRIWKPFQLIRGAWAVRVVGEEQFRLVADGLEGFNHPASWISWIVGRRPGLVDEDLTRGVPQFTESQAQASMGFLADAPESTVRFGSFTQFARDAQGVEARSSYRRWWGNSIAQAAEDPVVQRVATHMDDLDTVKEWFRPGNPIFDQLADSHPVLARRRAVANRYIDQVAENIRVLAGENPDAGVAANDRILQAFRDGAFTTDDGRRIPFNVSGEARLSREFVEALKPHVPTGPDQVVGRIAEDSPQRHGFVNSMFAALGAYPTNYLSRSPAFRQFYWRRVEEMIPLATSETQEAIIARAREAGLGRQQIGRLREFAARGRGAAGIEALDDIAKGHALDDTRNLLYDLSERTQFYDIHRLIFPFGEAWQEVLTRWAGLLRRNPRMVRRAQQGITEARNQGWFFTDENGNESFAYPASGLLLNAFGVNSPVRLVGGVAGLNMAAQLTPQVGPYVQMGAAAILPRTHEYRGVRSFVLPFGDQNESAYETVFPPYLERSIQAFGSPGDIAGVPDPLRGWLRRAANFIGGDSQQNQRDFMQTTNMVMASLMSTGRYGSSPAEQRRLERDARNQAATLTLFRAGASFFAPSAPRPEVSAEIQDGRTAVIARLSEEYQDLQYADDGPHLSADEAMRDMLDRYGENIYMALQSKSQAITIDPPSTREASEWAAAHPFARDRYSAVYGLFAPQDGEYDPNAAAENYEPGPSGDPDRVPRSPRQFRMAANNMLAMFQLHEAERQVGPESERTDAERQALREFRAWLNEEYPGFEDVAGSMQGPTTEEAIEQLREAARDDDMMAAAPDVTNALRDYLQARDEADMFVRRNPARFDGATSFRSSNSTAPVRDALRAYADMLISRTPDFAAMWERVFSRELADQDTRPGEEGG